MSNVPYDEFIEILDNVRDTLATARRAHPRLATDRAGIAEASGLSYATVQKMEMNCAVNLASVVAYAYALGKRVRIELEDIDESRGQAFANATEQADEEDDWDDDGDDL